MLGPRLSKSIPQRPMLLGRSRIETWNVSLSSDPDKVLGLGIGTKETWKVCDEVNL